MRASGRSSREGKKAERGRKPHTRVHPWGPTHYAGLTVASHVLTSSLLWCRSFARQVASVGTCVSLGQEVVRHDFSERAKIKNKNLISLWNKQWKRSATLPRTQGDYEAIIKILIPEFFFVFKKIVYQKAFYCYYMWIYYFSGREDRHCCHGDIAFFSS